MPTKNASAARKRSTGSRADTREAAGTFESSQNSKSKKKGAAFQVFTIMHILPAFSGQRAACGEAEILLFRHVGLREDQLQLAPDLRDRRLSMRSPKPTRVLTIWFPSPCPDT